jgi:carbamoyltransferase
LLPEHATRLRVQTVDASAGPFYDLLRAFGDLTGVPVLVNTSFNGFNEPIVCDPRDAVRVFYGTGLDMAVLGNLVIKK